MTDNNPIEHAEPLKTLGAQNAEPLPILRDSLLKSIRDSVGDNLSKYLKKEDADAKYQPKGEYVTLNEDGKINETYLPVTTPNQGGGSSLSTAPTNEIDPTLQQLLTEDGVTLTTTQKNQIIEAQKRNKNNYLRVEAISDDRVFIYFPLPNWTTAGSVIGLNVEYDNTIHHVYAFFNRHYNGGGVCTLLNDNIHVIDGREYEESGEVQLRFNIDDTNVKFVQVNDSPIFGCWCYTLTGCDVIPVGGIAFTWYVCNEPIKIYGGNSWKLICEGYSFDGTPEYPMLHIWERTG